MNYFINRIINLIYAKRKQIIFALFAFLYLIDNESSNVIIKSAAPAVVAGAAKVASAAGKVVETGAKIAGKVAETGVKTAGKVAETGTKTVSAAGKNLQTGAKSARSVGQNSDIPNAAGLKKSQNLMNNKLNKFFPQNTNPKTNNKMFSNNSSSVPDNNSISDSSISDNSQRKYWLKPFEPSHIEEEDEEEDLIMENASKHVIKAAPAVIVLLVIGGMFLFAMALPLMVLGSINATSSTLSQIDCTKQQGDVCELEDSEGGFFSKLKNLFRYGSYGSNSEVVLKEIEDTYDNIKEEYDFIISLSLLTSSIFTDTEYVKTEANNGKLVITDEMMERIDYIYPVAFLQLIPEYNVYTCKIIQSDNNNGEDRYDYDVYYEEEYQYTKIPTYEEGDTTEEEMELIPTGECDASTVGGLFKKINYFFDDELYFKRLKKSEELDSVYPDYNNDDVLLISKISNEYYIYKHVYNVDEELSYKNVPSQLFTDSDVNIQSPLNGWYSITSPFGNREGEYEGMHTGIDLVSSDKNIYAAGKGVVTRSNVETEGGNVIEITHTDRSGREYVTQYAHLSVRGVNVGDVVNAGDVIGVMGDTGTMASGVHLHFAMWNNETNEYYNPRKLFKNADNY